MKSGKPEKASVATFADHEVITPPNKLRKAWDKGGVQDDPVARAEQALATLSDEFSGWMESECARLDAARVAVHRDGLNAATRESLFHAAHDIKGHADTFGFPLASAAADSLCRLIELTPAACRMPLLLVDQHVDAVRAIVREHAQPHAGKMASDLTRRLRHVTEDYLITVNKEGLDELKGSAPPTAPNGK
jgi:hypothetical protein